MSSQIRPQNYMCYYTFQEANETGGELQEHPAESTRIPTQNGSQDESTASQITTLSQASVLKGGNIDLGPQPSKKLKVKITSGRKWEKLSFFTKLIYVLNKMKVT